MLPKVVVIGNCQAQFIEGMFSVASTLDVERVSPNFLLSENDREDVLGKIENALVVFVQRTADDFRLEWIRSQSILASYPEKTFVWPNIYFDGYFPNTRYVYLNQWGKLQSPLEDYHLTPVFEAWKAGQTVAQAVVQLKEGFCGGDDPFEASLGQLRDREKDCMICISDFLERVIYQQRCFYTPNHPHTELLIEMARRLAFAAKMPFDLSKASSGAYKLDRIDIPTFEWIRARYSLAFDAVPLYKGRIVEKIADYKVVLGDSCLYNEVELIEAFYRVYEAAL
ncbi:WcbI family polysaccharide biosynthesis putative acetyltransferase [Acidocella aromatica]|uniref:Polysaccharide biosynthesis enzyme WcbI domain-containing protein n=1 Tax=Acidocella aromatica TaxID=1303579 RepID=A0A840VKI5_9PROT|nr:WcbI family polysaccharide biosynthesis putative acetyltransferase [Acidocella aromatica]MBB5372749.1 hypothetical protein [Acidocella aromatica]